MNNRGTILVVDDDSEALRVLAGILQPEGYTIRPANSGELALASIAAQLPDLILLDIRMPDIDGFEICRRLKADESTRNIPVIFQSAAIDLADRLEGLKQGAVDYISKPFQREELLARVRTHLELGRLRCSLEELVKERTAQLESEIAERMRAEAELRLNLVRQKALLDVYLEMPRASVQGIIALVVDKCVNLTGSTIGFVGLISDDDQRMEAHIWSEETMENCPLDKSLHFPLSEAGLWAEPVRQGRMIIDNDFRKPNPLKKGYPRGHLELERFMGIPVVYNGRVVAVAGVANSRKDYAEADHYAVSLLLEGMWEIIKRIQAEELLRRSEETVRIRERMLNESQRVGQVGGWDWDAVNDVIWWSDEYCRIFGFKPGMLPPNYQEHLKAYTPESAELLDSAVKRSMELGEPYELDLELSNPTPTTRWICASCEVKLDENGHIWGLRGTAQNITERKMASQTLQRMNEELEQRVRERTAELAAKNAELERVNKVFVGRELRMVELKKRIMELEQRIRQLDQRESS